jgi:hypothetical protein
MTVVAKSDHGTNTDPGKDPGAVSDALGKIITFCGGAGSRTLVKGPNRNERRRGLTHQTHEIVWTSRPVRSRAIPHGSGLRCSVGAQGGHKI